MVKRVGEIVHYNRKYLLLGFLLLLLGSLLGFLNAEGLKDMANQLLKELGRIAEDIQEKESPLYTFWIIFQNNVVSSLSMLGLGVFFGIYPVFGLFANGVLLGFMLKMYALNGINPLKILVYGILPHGVIELSAVIFATSIGIRYGVLTFKLAKSLFNRERRSVITKEYTRNLRYLPVSVGVIIVLLLIAALIETTVTPVILQTMMGDELKAVNMQF